MPTRKHLSKKWIFSQKKGFTLVEIAIVMIIVGLLLGLGAGMVGPLTKRVKLNESRETVSAAVDSVIGYASINNRVPPNLALFQTTVRTQNDAWGRPLVYVFDNNLATSVCNRTATNITVQICNDTACTTFSTINNVAFLVMSAGDNANNQTYGSLPPPAVPINTYLVGIPVDNYAGDFSRPTDEYDDIVKWITLPELQTKMSCQVLRVVTRDLTIGSVGSPYPSTTLSATGGTSPYLWAIQAGALPAGLTLTASTGVISGTPTPTAAGTYPFTVRVTDNLAFTALQQLSITINP
jgi:prepilin-type N-terminal cleavage/methylation domain-containing protein